MTGWIIAGVVIAILFLYGLPLMIMAIQFKVNEWLHPTITYNDPLTHRLVKKFAKLILWYGRVKYTLHGAEHQRHQNVVVYSNHQSTFDGVILNDIYMDDHVGGIIKDGIYKIPIVPFWMRVRRHLPLNRKNNREGIKTMLQAIDYAKEGPPFFIFPEGTRSNGKTMLEYRDGAFKLAEKAKQAIQVMVIHNGYEHRFLKPRHIHVELLPAIEYETIKDLDTKQLSSLVRSKMQEALDRGV
jgi:1-acyl-sn-glycerol-3-phosphate acyltransferase